MREIKEIAEFINEELDDAQKYIDYAAKMKGIDELAFQTAMKLAADEISHADTGWHSVAVKKITAKQAEMKAAGKETPAYMLEAWQDTHEKLIRRVGTMKYELESLKNA